MTRMLDRLEEKQLVKRERSLEDRRVIEIRLTDHGCELLPRLREIGERVLSRLVQGFDAAEEDLCRGLLRRMADNLVEARPVGDPAHAPAAKP
jgi:DNA-binding MarR family transcriptional regulator